MKKKLIVILTLITTIIAQAQDNKGVIVLELFTSQGCSSCPPADALLDEIKEKNKDKEVYVLSYHVDYWNRLGWKDPFSSERFTLYQNEYANEFYSRSIYTPQLVVNGSEHLVGSNKSKVYNIIRKYETTTTTNSIQLTNVKKEKGEIVLNYNVEGEKPNRLTLALVINERITKIIRGENRNRTLKNTNIVANRVVVTPNENGEASIAIPSWVKTTDKLSVIAYTQDDDLKTMGATATIL